MWRKPHVEREKGMKGWMRCVRASPSRSMGKGVVIESL